MFTFYNLYCSLLMLFIPNKDGIAILGGKKKKREHFHIEIWDDVCLDREKDLDDILDEYENNKIGQNIRKFIKFYRSTMTTRCVMKYLLRNILCKT